MRRYVIAAIAGAVVAWMIAAFVHYAVFVAGGYASEALVEPPPWVLLAIPGCGALGGLTLARLGGHLPLPRWARPVALGTLAGVAAVVLAAEIGSSDGPKGAGKFRHAALVYGVPTGLVVGAVAGLVWVRRRPAALS